MSHLGELDRILAQKLRTVDGRRQMAEFAAAYCRDVSNKDCNFDSDSHRMMLLRISEILRAHGEEPKAEKNISMDVLAAELERWKRDNNYIPIINDMEMFLRMRTPYFDFGTALRKLRAGKKVTRLGWNGNKQPERIHYSDRGVELDCEGSAKFVAKMYLFLPTTWEIRFNGDPMTTNTEGVRSFICMKDADSKIVVGWLASQTDLLAEDYVEVP